MTINMTINDIDFSYRFLTRSTNIINIKRLTTFIDKKNVLLELSFL